MSQPDLTVAKVLMKHQNALLIAALAAVTPISLAAQDSLVHATIDSGTLVRVRLESGALVRGRLVEPLTPSSTVIRFCRYPAPVCTNPSDTITIQRFPTSSLRSVEVKRGSHWAIGALVGGLIGGGLMAVASGSQSDYVAVGVVSIGVLGAVIGGGSPRWGAAP